MKVLLIFASMAFISAHALELPAEFKSIQADCQKELNPTPANLAKLREGIFVEDDESLKCYIKCVFAYGWVNGKPDDAIALKILGPVFGEEKIKSSLAKCNGIVGNTDCDSAYKVYQCHVKEGTAHVL